MLLPRAAAPQLFPGGVSLSLVLLRAPAFTHGVAHVAVRHASPFASQLVIPPPSHPRAGGRGLIPGGGARRVPALVPDAFSAAEDRVAPPGARLPAVWHDEAALHRDVHSVPRRRRAGPDGHSNGGAARRRAQPLVREGDPASRRRRRGCGPHAGQGEGTAPGHQLRRYEPPCRPAHRDGHLLQRPRAPPQRTRLAAQPGGPCDPPPLLALPCSSLRAAAALHAPSHPPSRRRRSRSRCLRRGRRRTRRSTWSGSASCRRRRR